MARIRAKGTTGKRVGLAQMPPSNARPAFFLICGLLLGIIWLVFGQTLGHDFINYDDPTYVYQNPKITGGISLGSMAWAFTHVHAENWHPLTTLSHMTDCQFFGLRPGWHHFVNVMLHCAAAILLFFVFERMTSAVWASGFVAAVFAIHPLHVESVAWIAERKDLLSGVFFLLTLIAYLQYVRKPSVGRYLTMSILFVCGLLSKPMLITMPLVLLLVDYWPLDRFSNSRSTITRLFVEKILLFVLSIASSIATLFAQQQSLGSTEHLPIEWRLENAVVSYVAYVGQMFWPTHLAPFYPHPESGLSLLTILGSTALLVAVTAIAFMMRQKHPYLLTGWLWYVVMLLPVLGVVQVGWQARADRYTYLPEIGVCLAFTWLIVDFCGKWRKHRTILVVAAAIIAVLTWRAWVQTSYWKNSEALWSRTLEVTQDNDVAHNNLGAALLQRGLVDEALPHFQLATNLRPGNASAQDNLARIFRKKGRIEEAITHSRKLIELQPKNVEARDMLGALLLQQGKVEEAITQWRGVLEIQADSYAQNSLAWVLATYPEAAIRDGVTAVKLAQAAVELSGGNNPIALRTLAAAYAESGRFSEAIEHAKRGLELAGGQGDSNLVEALRREIGLYREGSPLRASYPTMK